MQEYEIAVVGAGASGLMAAAKAASLTTKKVVLLEGNQKPGKKLLATGNGRCNLSNRNLDTTHYHGDTAALPGLLSRYGCACVCGEFVSMGLLTAADGEGRVYPQSNQAASVLKVLSDVCRERGVDCIQDFTAFSALKVAGGFAVKSAQGQELRAKKLILCTGGAASPRHSCAGGTGGLPDSYRMAQQLGHSVTTLYPALTRLTVKHKFLKSLSGARCKGAAALLGDGRLIYSETGELLFGDDAVSGICVFGLSLRAAEFFSAGKCGGKSYKSLALKLDLCPSMDEEALCGFLTGLAARRPTLLAGDCLSGVLHGKIGLQVVRACGVDTMAPVSELKPGDFTRIAGEAKAVTLPVSGTGGWDDAQVTGGGVPMCEVDPATMESKKCPGLYLAGELLNVHGDCGGYNLHFAWMTGLLAGEAASGAKIVL